MDYSVKRPKILSDYRTLMTVIVDDGRNIPLSSPEFLSCLTGGHTIEIKLPGESKIISPGITITITYGIYCFEYPIESSITIGSFYKLSTLIDQIRIYGANDVPASPASPASRYDIVIEATKNLVLELININKDVFVETMSLNPVAYKNVIRFCCNVNILYINIESRTLSAVILDVLENIEDEMADICSKTMDPDKTSNFVSTHLAKYKKATTSLLFIARNNF